MAKVLNLQLFNKSSLLGNFCIFAKPRTGVPNGGKVYPIAFLVEPVPPQKSHTFTWNTEKCFIFDQDESLIPGRNFFPGGLLDCRSNNRVTLDYTVIDGYRFTDAVNDKSLPDGALTIRPVSAVPFSHVNVGIGMDHTPLYATQAVPNAESLFVHDQPIYYISFGKMTPGEILEPANLPVQAKFEFPKGIDTMFVTFNQDNTFTFEKPKK